MKTCSKCNIEKPIDQFHNRKASKDGKTPHCIECSRTIKSTYYNKNKVTIKNKVKIYSSSHKLEKALVNKTWHLANKETQNIKSKKYGNDNKITRKLYFKKYKKHRLLTDELFKLTYTTRRLINRCFNSNKSLKTQEILGCSFNEFKQHLESKFQDWMNWENKGLYNGTPNFGWDIDHIQPLSTAKTTEDIIKLNHFTNLQPLCSYINRNIKRDKY